MLDLDLLVFLLGPPLISVDGNKPGYCKLVTSEGSIFKGKRQAKDSKTPRSLDVSWVPGTLILDLSIMSHKNEKITFCFILIH